MKLENYPEEKLKGEIKKIFEKYLDLKNYKIFIFGSRIRGDNFSRADIDIGIDGPEEVSGKILSAIEEDIENLPTLYKFDIVDFKKATEKFKKEALKNIEYVN